MSSDFRQEIRANDTELAPTREVDRRSRDGGIVALNKLAAYAKSTLAMECFCFWWGSFASRHRKRLIMRAERCERVYKRTAKPNVTFCREEERRSG